MCNPLTLNPSSSAADCLTQQNCDVDQPDRVQIVTSAAQVIPNLWAANGPDECQTDSSLLTPKMAPSSTQTLSSGMIKSAAGPGDTPSMVSVKERIAAENAAAQERATRAEKFGSRRTSSGTPCMLLAASETQSCHRHLKVLHRVHIGIIDDCSSAQAW